MANPINQTAVTNKSELGLHGIQTPIQDLDPKSPEDVLYEILSSVLRIDLADLDKSRSFLSLGGDSLLAIKVMGRCRTKGITLNVIDLIEAKSLFELSQRAGLYLNKSVAEISPIPRNNVDQNITNRLLGSESYRVESIQPCSPIQDDFLASQSTNPSLYQCCFVLRFVGNVADHPVKARRLGEAWKSVVQRHSILRTIFVDSISRPGQFEQVVLGGYEPAIEYEEGEVLTFISHSPPTFQPSKVAHRLQLAQTSYNEVFLRLDINHALVDGQSTQCILTDLFEAYKERPNTSPALQYDEFVAHLGQMPTQTSQTYWMKYLSNAKSTYLPMDHGHATLSGLDTLQAKLSLDYVSIQEFCGTYGVTLANVCQLAWGLVLRSFTGLDDVVFSFITSGRSDALEGIQDAVGPYVSTMPCRIKFDGKTHVEIMLSQIAQDLFNGFEHRYAPISNKNAAIELPSARQLGNTTMSYQREIENAPIDSGIRFTVEKRSNPTDYDIALGIGVNPSGINIDLDYWQSRMNTEHAQVVLKTFCEAIHVILRAPSSPATQLSLLTADDERQIQAWNRDMPTVMPYCLHEQVATIAHRQPHALAVCSFDGDLTYVQLMSAANRLAHHLVSCGVRVESMVGLCIDKSKWAIISMLAILQAGGVVVPLGVTHPLARVEGIIKDASISLILVDKGQKLRLNELAHSPFLVTVDSALHESLPVKFSAPQTACTPSSGAWVIFTSGSTGTPKGVVLEHRALCTSVYAHGTAFAVGPHTRAAQFAAYTFDVSISDIFSTLHHGGCICVFSEASRMDNLTETLQEMRVNYINLTPTVLRLLDPSALPLITTAVVGGEPLDADLVAKWAPKATVHNSYGPSECAIISAAYSVSDPAEAAIVGFPTGTRFWVAEVGDSNRLCPRGVPGELLIDGPLLSRGYLNDPGKTASSFITNPRWATHFGLPSHLRFYRTGDLVRQNANGSLTHMGRRDTQVKIRGQRVEIEEIEHWVTKVLEGTRIVCVLVTGQSTKSEQIGLAAVVEFAETSIHYVDPIANGKGRLAPTAALMKQFDAVRAALFEVLPAYMVPRLYLPVAEMPLNPSGKLDRKAVKHLIESIPIIDLQQYTTNTKAAISTYMEKQLQQLWSQVLAVEPDDIGAHDHFYQIGGDSVGAIRLVGAARSNALGVRLTVSDILKYPRLSELARILDNRVTGDLNQSLKDSEQKDPAPFGLWEDATVLNQPEVIKDKLLLPIAEACGVNVDEIEDVYPCTPLQEGLMAITARQPTAYISSQAFSLDETVDISKFQKAWETVVDAAPILRTRILFQPEGTSLQVVIRGTLKWHYSSSLAEHLSDGNRTMVSPGQPLNEFGLIQEASGHRVFVWKSHHSTYDGWSKNLILQQVAAVYLQASSPQQVPYARFIQHLMSADQEITQQYWEEQLCGNPSADFPPMLHASYHPRPQSETSHKFNIQSLSYMTSGTTMSDVLRAAWALVVARQLGTDDVVFAVSLSGRNASVADVENLMAPTLTTVPLRIHVDSKQDVKAFLEGIRQQGIGMIPHEHTGLQRIKQLLPDHSESLNLRHLFIVQPAAQTGVDSNIPGVTTLPLDSEEFDSYGLNVECNLSTNAIVVNVRYDKNIISSHRLARLLEQFEHVTRQFCIPATLELSLEDVELITPQDLQQIAQWNRVIQPKVMRCVHELVEDMAMKQPTALAIDAWDGKLTYQELMMQASQLAHFLVQLGVNPGRENKIGLCMEKSKFMPVAMLAILLAGGVVLPLGVAHPVTRIDNILKDSASDLILVDAGQAIRLAGLKKKTTNIVRIDDMPLNSLQTSGGPPHTDVSPDKAAWIISTSGSTGIPKLVVLEHNALATSILAHGERFGFGIGTRVMQFAALTFDAVIQDCFTTLTFGGTVCIASEHDRMNNLGGSMRSMAVSMVNLTSTVAGLLMPSEVPNLKKITLGGEAVTADVVEKWSEHVELLNTYGPSECSINSTCNGPLKDPQRASNIGWAMGTRLWVANASNPNQLCPIGVAGELLIEGPLLAREYLNDAEKTSAAFLTNLAFMKKPELGLSAGCRVYRTGDIVVQNEDGSHTFLGRGDMQIKIRGQRVEIGEIEYWIKKLQVDIRIVTVVFTNRGKKDQPRLVAIIEFENDSKHCQLPTTEEGLLEPTDNLNNDFRRLRSSLLETIPSYMVPSIFLPVSKIPLNQSGKLDRRAAREIVDSIGTEKLLQYTTSTERVAPSSDTEQQLVDLWSLVLGMDGEIGTTDNFFQIGGDSVAAMRVVAAARSTNLQLSVADIFQHPRLTDLADALDERASEDSLHEAPVIIEAAPFDMWRDALGV